MTCKAIDPKEDTTGATHWSVYDDDQRVDFGPFESQAEAEAFAREMNSKENDHAANIGKIVIALAQHTPGDWGDCSINNPITSILDRREPAHMLIKALDELDPDTARGIVEQLKGPRSRRS